ncbi:hypothetical protein [Xylanibacter muris]|uniref:Glycine zipper domain-containing protein n=1 Tax=Xylanibacter muris TaxID=2736290 RepID=A0ABX2AMK7_9BACT|nr:hypothetical protein [Xylanibacter muris]NPD92434.1 hypothetical protein [Xylanibacter muris]
MRKSLTAFLCACLLLYGCRSSSEGAYNGAMFGSMLGSAIGGIIGGYGGSDIGQVVGMAGGAAVGAAVGNANEKKAREAYSCRAADDAYPEAVSSGSSSYGGNDSGFDPSNGGDDRISFDETSGSYLSVSVSGGVSTNVVPDEISTQSLSVEQLAKLAPGYSVRFNPLVEIRNATFSDADGDGILSSGEKCTVAFDIVNNSSEVLYDVRPTVFESTGNKRIHISPGIRVESIAPYKGVRYTAMVVADKKLKDGEAVIKVAVAQGDRELTSSIHEFNIVTRR